MKKLGFGLMRLPLRDANDSSSIDIELTKQMVDEYLAAGFTYFDTAWMYCGNKSEEATREFLVSRYDRNRFTLTTKLPFYMIHSEADRDKIFNEQLRRTGAGYFDYYLIHDVNSNTVTTFEKYDCFNWLREKKRQGLVKSIGFSFHDGPELLERVLTDYPDMEFVQLQINYLDWDSAGVQSKACYEVARKHNKQIIVMEPVKGGMLANVPKPVEMMFKKKDPSMSCASWAIRFAAGLPGVMTVLSGMSDLSQLRDNISYMADFKPLDEEEMETVYAAARMINENIAIPCTGCAYCVVDCPKNIAIPKYFSLYNTDLQEKNSGRRAWTSQECYYETLTVNFGRASDCIKCGRCETMCPQHLHIRELLETVAEHFE
ncbi:MAG: aldo/keto reductase [Clostridia bacterium]|nr:aldo/keto reductase [Clostridia bacterium]MBQ8474967.1 aldo/keto reductase [Clostridia bacterium]